MRRMIWLFLGSVLLASSMQVAYAQNAQDCSALMRFGIYDKFQTLTAESRYRQIRDFLASDQFSTRQQAESKAASLGLNIVDVLGLTLGGSSSSSNFEQWRQALLRTSFEEARNAGLRSESVERISSTITELVGRCIGQRGLHVYVIPSNDQQGFSFTVDFVPLSDETPRARGSIAVRPSSVAATCAPAGRFDQPLDIGPQGVSFSCRRLSTDTVQITVNSNQGSPVVNYERYVAPTPVISFTTSDDEIDAGRSATLRWDVQNALRVQLGNTDVPSTGSQTISPNTTTEYTLRVTSLDGRTTSSAKRVSVRPPPPTFSGAQVWFHTTNNDKDRDTRVTVAIKCAGNTIASWSGVEGRWPDNSDRGPYALQVVEQPRKSAVLGVCQVVLVESPNGHDEWHFHWALELSFSDGSKKRFDWNDGNVDHDRATVTKPLP